MSGAGGPASWGVPAALLGGAACIGCTLSLVAALGSAVGLTAAAPILGLPLWALVGLSLLLVAGAVWTVARLRRAEEACLVPPARSPYLRFSMRNAVLGLALAVGAVVGTALVAKLVIEGAGLATYTIHWTTTVPALVAAFAWIFHGQLNARPSRA